MAHSVTEEIMRIADRKNDVSYAVEANRVRGMTMFYRGDFSEAQVHIARTVSLHDPEYHQQHALRFGLDPLVCCHAYLGYTHLFLGQAEDAIAASNRAVDEAKRIDHLYSQAFALAFAAFVRVNLEMPEDAARLAQATIDCAQESEIQFFANQQQVVKAWAKTLPREGSNAAPDPRAVDEMAERVDVFLGSRTSIGATRVMCMMAETSLRSARYSEAQSMLRRALDRSDEKGEVYYLAEIRRLQAELVWANQGRDGAKDICEHLTSAIDTADNQQAAIWIRRTAQTTQRLHGLIAARPAPGGAPELASFTDDEVELAQRVAYARNLLDRIGSAA